MSTRDSDAYSMVAGSDLTLKEGCLGKQSAGTVIPCSVLGERADVVIGSAGIAGATVDVYPRQGKKVIATIGAVAIAAGAELTTDANGLLITAVSTNVVRAKALFAGNAGEKTQIHWVDAYVKP